MALVKTRNVRNYTASLQDLLANGAKVEFGTVAFDNQYPTGGEAVTFTGFKEVAFLTLTPTSGYIFQYDYTNKKILAYVTGASTGGVFRQVASSADLSALTSVPYFAVGY